MQRVFLYNILEGLRACLSPERHEKHVLKLYIDTLVILLFQLTAEHVRDGGKTNGFGPRYRGTNRVLTQRRVRLMQGALGKAPPI